MFALVDCNNFYASCERVFNPALEKKPIVILSNNDGCVIARSNEAKRLRVPMGAPFFSWKEFFTKNNVYVFSSNYALYGDMSNRIMLSLAICCSDIEIYSIDEAFLILPDVLKEDFLQQAFSIKEKIKTWTGIPVSIGIAPTKTLAKIANYIAKKKSKVGVFDLINSEIREGVLSEFSVANIWGIGKRTAVKLKNMNIHTAIELRDADLKMMRRKFSIVMEKIICELRGISCLPLEDVQPKKQIMSSRSFGKTVYQLAELEEAVSHYTALACNKLRQQQSTAQGISVYIRTSFFLENTAQYGNSIMLSFLSATDDTRIILKTALQGLRQIFKKNCPYRKAGIVLLGLNHNNKAKQVDIFDQQHVAQSPLMKTVDSINYKLGKNTVFLCAEGTTRSWQALSNYRSPRYTTQWRELVKAHCD